MPKVEDEASTSRGEAPKVLENNEDITTLQDRIDAALRHALINQSGVLVNTLTNVVRKVVAGTITAEEDQGLIYS